LRAMVSAVTEPEITPQRPLCLGSASPRRRELLTGLGLPLRVVITEIDEEPRSREAPLDYLVRVVQDKLRAAAAKRSELEPCAALLVADTIVRVDDRVIGKPCDTAGALTLLQILSGREHIVHTRYAVSSANNWGVPLVERTVTSSVYLREAPLDTLRRYAETGEGLDKAGAYAVQGIGAFLVERIEGSYSNVVGLPVCEVIRDLTTTGLVREFP
jgi:septum formation protein